MKNDQTCMTIQFSAECNCSPPEDQGPNRQVRYQYQCPCYRKWQICSCENETLLRRVKVVTKMPTCGIGQCLFPAAISDESGLIHSTYHRNFEVLGRWGVGLKSNRKWRAVGDVIWMMTSNRLQWNPSKVKVVFQLPIMEANKERDPRVLAEADRSFKRKREELLREAYDLSRRLHEQGFSVECFVYMEEPDAMDILKVNYNNDNIIVNRLVM